MELIEGNWYKGQKDNYYIKFSHYKQSGEYKMMYYTESFSLLQGWEKEKDYWCNNDLEKFALNNPVTIEELHEILPKDHPDLNKNIQYEIY